MIWNVTRHRPSHALEECCSSVLVLNRFRLRAIYCCLPTARVLAVAFLSTNTLSSVTASGISNVTTISFLAGIGYQR
jgi:hypothetical protein